MKTYIVTRTFDCKISIHGMSNSLRIEKMSENLFFKSETAEQAIEKCKRFIAEHAPTYDLSTSEFSVKENDGSYVCFGGGLS